MKRTLIISLAMLFSGIALAQQPAPPADEIVQDASNAFTTWSGANTYLAKQMNALATAYRSLKAENAQLKDDLAKAKTAAPAAPPSSGSVVPGPASPPGK